MAVLSISCITTRFTIDAFHRSTSQSGHRADLSQCLYISIYVKFGPRGRQKHVITGDPLPCLNVAPEFPPSIQ